MRAVSGYASLDARCLVKNLSIIRCKRPSRFQFPNLPTYLSVSFDRSDIISSVSSSRDTTRYVETRIWHRTALYWMSLRFFERE